MRRTNEDSFTVDPERGVFVVADGMGGHAAGEIASSLAVDAVTSHLSASLAVEPAERLRQGFEEAQRAIVACCEGDPRTEGMGTTLTVALLDERRGLTIGHLGDSRAYMLRGGSITALTRDHTWVQREIDAGRMTRTEARAHKLSHVLTRVLTAEDPPIPDIESTTLTPGDTLLLCTDGLHNHLDDQDIREILDTEASAAAAVARLIKTANRRGGSDNVTAIVVRVS